MKIISFGEILLRLSTSANKLLSQSDSLELHVGGAEANVAVSLAKMGLNSSMVSALPYNKLGDKALEELRRSGVYTGDILRNEGRQGIYFLEQGSAFRGSEVVYDRNNSAFSILKPGDIDWNGLFEGVDWFHLSGISPAVSASASEVCLEAVRQAKAAGLKTSVDLNYRSKLWNYGKEPKEIMPELVNHACLLIGDPATANKMLGTNLPTKFFLRRCE